MAKHVSRPFVSLIALSLLLSDCSQENQHSDRPRNVILISIDTLRADHLGCYGYSRGTSPRIDAYARTGTIFRNTTSSSSWTAPAHLTMLTGLGPFTHGYVNYTSNVRINENTETIASVLANNGFRTAAFTGGGHAGAKSGLDIGFERYETYGRRFEDNLDEAWKWLDDTENAPFFLFLHGFNVHKPYQPPQKYQEMFSDGYSGSYHVSQWQPENPRPSEVDASYVVSQYDGEIAYVDDLLGDFLEQLDRRGILKETLVIITSDHGDEFYEHGMIDHIHSLYDELIQVPWIMFGPTVPRGVVRDQVGAIDIFPTLMEMVGLDAPSVLQGHSRTGLMSGVRNVESGAVFSFTGFTEYPYRLSSIRTEKWKLVDNNLSGMKDVSWSEDNPRPRYAYKFKKRTDDFVELFDIIEDPLEKENLAEQFPETVEELQNEIRDRKRRSRKLRRQTRDSGPATEEQLKILRSLGYVE